MGFFHNDYPVYDVDFLSLRKVGSVRTETEQGAVFGVFHGIFHSPCPLVRLFSGDNSGEDFCLPERKENADGDDECCRREEEFRKRGEIGRKSGTLHEKQQQEQIDSDVAKEELPLLFPIRPVFLFGKFWCVFLVLHCVYPLPEIHLKRLLPCVPLLHAGQRIG